MILNTTVLQDHHAPPTSSADGLYLASRELMGALRRTAAWQPPRTDHTTAWPLSLLRFRWHSRGLRQATYLPSPPDTAPQYRRHRARRGPRNFEPFLALWSAGTALA
jgi:hypothetical protein